MVKQFRFNFKLDADDRDRLLLVSRRLQRTQADTVRWLIRKAAADWSGERPRGLAGYRPRGDVLRIEGDWEIPFSDAPEAGHEPY